jgi:hypothetical protein
MRFELGECDLHKCVDLRRENCFLEKFPFQRDWIYAKISGEGVKKCLIMEKFFLSRLMKAEKNDFECMGNSEHFHHDNFRLLIIVGREVGNESSCE